MSDQAIRAKLERAEKVQRLLKDPEIVAAFDNCKQAIFQKIEQTPIRDAEGLTQLRLCLKLLNDVKANLENVLNEGKAIEFNIEKAKQGFLRRLRG